MRIGSRLLVELGGGEVISECSVQTSDNTKVADVVWLSEGFVAEHGMTTPYLIAPEICVEILRKRLSYYHYQPISRPSKDGLAAIKRLGLSRLPLQ